MTQLSVNQLIDLEYFRKGWEGSYKTRVEDIRGNTLTLGMPFVDGGGLLPVREGESVTLRFWDRVASYSGATVITQVILEPLPMFKVQVPQEVERIQRRTFVRIEANLQLRFVQPQSQQSIPAKTIDISAGGLRFNYREPIEPGTIIDLNVNFKEFLVSTKGEIIRVIWEKSGQYHICVKFIDLPQEQVDKIVKWVFGRQLALRKRGLL